MEGHFLLEFITNIYVFGITGAIRLGKYTEPNSIITVNLLPPSNDKNVMYSELKVKFFKEIYN